MLAEKIIRLIGIWDNVDTAKVAPGEAFQIQLENIVNDMYLRDASRKVHSSFDNLRKQGLLYTKIPYGYKSVKGKMYVDENTAPIVKRIFDEYVNGRGFTEIAGGLMEEDVPRPGKANVWYPATVRAILTNRAYTGEYISGKTRQEMHNLHDMPEESWIRIKDHHEAIISDALFDAAQERLIPRDYVRQVVEPDSYGELVGIAFCGNCDKPLLNKDRKYFCKKCKVEVVLPFESG